MKTCKLIANKRALRLVLTLFTEVNMSPLSPRTRAPLVETTKTTATRTNAQRMSNAEVTVLN